MDVLEIFDSILKNHPDQAIAVAGILTLLEVVKNTKSSTVMGLREEIENASKILVKKNPFSVSLESGCQLFSIFISRLDTQKDFEGYIKSIIARADHFAQMSLKSREKIVSAAKNLIKEKSTIFTHGYSRAVYSILKQASDERKTFRVFICEGKPSGNSYKLAEKLKNEGIRTIFVLDSAIPLAIEQSDFVLVGAEGVVECGGIISQVGTNCAALIAKSLRKPFYVAAESYKFNRSYPLGNRDITEATNCEIDVSSASSNLLNDCFGDFGNSRDLKAESQEQKNGVDGLAGEGKMKIDFVVPRLDYTSPDLVSLLFTDLGVMRTSNVSEELIKLYY